jgi:Family of unknown function (DUF5372)
MRSSPSLQRRDPSGAHNARSLTFEVAITYPFHPLNGQTVVIIGDHSFAGERHLIIRKPDGGAYYVPAWMASEKAGAIRTVARPRLSVDCLLELRQITDRLIGFSSEQDVFLWRTKQ